MPLARRDAALALLALLALAAAACTSPEERFAEHLARAGEYEREGRRAEAILEYGSAINVDGSDPVVHERLANLLRRQGELQEAARHYREAHELDPTRVDSAMRELRLIVFSNRARADRLLARALEEHPERASVHRAAAEIALVDGDPVRGLAAAQRALELGPEDPESWTQLARVHQGQLRQDQLRRRPSDASVYRAGLDALARADELLGGDVAVRLERARVLAAWPDHAPEAQAAYEDALALARERGERDVHLIAAHTLDDFARSRRDRELRVRALREIIGIAPDKIDAWRSLADALEGEPERVEALLAELLESQPREPRAHRFYVSRLLAAGRTREALAHLERTLEDGIASPPLWDDLIRLRLRRGQLERGREALEALAEAYPGHPLTRRAKARVALAEGRAADAAEILRRIPEARDSTEAQRLLALAEHRAGDAAAAREAIERAAALAQGFSPPVETLRTRIACDSHPQQWVRCLRALRRLEENGVALRPEDQLRHARALYALKRRPQARAVLEALLAGDDPPARAAVEYARQEGAERAEQAYAHLEAAHARQPGTLSVLQALADLDAEAGRSERSIARLSAVLEAGGGGPVALLLRADLLARAGNLERAESDALRAFEARPGLPGATDLLLAIYEKQRALEKTRRAFEEAEAAGVLHPGARLLLGRIHAREGDLARAETLLEDVVEQNPRLASARSALAIVLARRESQLGRALKLAREATDGARPRREALHALGYVYLRSGLHEAAVVELRRALELRAALGSRGEPTLRYHLGLALRALDRDDQAEQAFRTALDLDAEFPEAARARQELEAIASRADAA